MSSLPLANDNGITVGELREWLQQFPDDGEVWLTNYSDGLTNVCVKADPLNQDDVSLSPRVRHQCRHDYELIMQGIDGPVHQCRKCDVITVG